MSVKPFIEKLVQFKKQQENVKVQTVVSKASNYCKSKEDYEVPVVEIGLWIENGWKYNEFDNKMYRKGREAVNVQQSKKNKDDIHGNFKRQNGL